MSERDFDREYRLRMEDRKHAANLRRIEMAKLRSAVEISRIDSEIPDVPTEEGATRLEALLDELFELRKTVVSHISQSSSPLKDQWKESLEDLDLSSRDAGPALSSLAASIRLETMLQEVALGQTEAQKNSDAALLSVIGSSLDRLIDIQRRYTE